MEILMILLEIFDKVSCSVALVLGICLVPYSIYNSISFIINKIGLYINGLKNTSKGEQLCVKIVYIFLAQEKNVIYNVEIVNITNLLQLQERRKIMNRYVTLLRINISNR